ncbi:hypothetical protein APHAL10511_004234 [Amanita phalloides]|nr:hypothetical protein APHAL10511_004234 [Amanita phalloides]
MDPMQVEEALLTSLTPSTSENFNSGQHKKGDEEITLAATRIFGGKRELSEIDNAVLLQCIIRRSEGKLQAAFINIENGIELMRENPKLTSALKKAWRTENYMEIRESELLTVPKPGKDDSVGQKAATENAWTTQYHGGAPAILWTRIKEVMEQAIHESRYARYLEIVQSSGTGKSRMIEELSKAHLVIPVNLRGSDDTGYPPPDKSAHVYLSGTTEQQEARVHAVAFLRAVFKEASKLITELREPLPKGTDCHDQIVDSFSKYMSEGMRWDSHGAKRRSFYEKVKSGAVELEKEINHTFATNSRRGLDHQLRCVGICEAFNELIVILSSLRTPSLRHRKANPEPLVILAFDEASILAGPNELWSHFSELRRVLHALISQPLFSLFLTTTGNVDALVPSSQRDLSGRIQSQVLSASRPFTEVGFDHFAFKNQFDLRVVAGDKHISHFGRPLWATRYEKGDDAIKSEIIQFAALKLRAGRTWPGNPLNKIEKLACLAQRLPIEFHSITYASKKNELELVEGHMRILLGLDAGFESLTTVSASEPLLSEAAYWMMAPDTRFKAAETLKGCLDGYSIHKGDRGELLVMLLFTLARDRAIGHPNMYGQPDSGERWCLVPNFMHALFKFKFPPPSDTLQKNLFDESKIFFNHWVKVHQEQIVNVKYLARLMRRGAAVLCTTTQAGINGIIPFLVKGYKISSKNIGVILFQVKNDSKFTHNPQPGLFKAMDPYALGILNPGDNVPIIRIVFALASKTPCLTHVTSCQQDGIKSCDYWVGGISPTVFSPVGNDDASIWMALLQATYGC